MFKQTIPSLPPATSLPPLLCVLTSLDVWSEMGNSPPRAGAAASAMRSAMTRGGVELSFLPSSLLHAVEDRERGQEVEHLQRGLEGFA